ncbi:hypothetical protein GE061_007977 [Apolygus lucorum]|uniref:Peptidase S1 domain-containing protein n=1 Tax=Apolygus lucorum TaxID=248454 RepID=A0A8S9WME8_APOLU|nr:hypothetical protein GE061_007977 [Apolygus lucorum]
MFMEILVSSVLLTLPLNVLGLTRGRDAKEGEFPFVVRILVSEKASDASNDSVRMIQRNIEGYEDTFGDFSLDEYDDSRISKRQTHKVNDELIKEFSSNNATKISAGVLISTTRVLTTCSSVASFTGTKTIDFPLSQVLINAGSIYRTGEFGEFKNPNSSTRHPYCHFMISTRTILFDYGIYEVDTPFGEGGNTGAVAPIHRSFKNSEQLDTALQRMLTSISKTQCKTIGWGNFDKRFEGKGAPDNFERFSNVLQTTSMEIVDFPECYKATCQEFQMCLNPLLEYGYFCAKAVTGGPCIEDWSSPLTCNGDLFGIHVLPHRCTDRGFPRLFLRVDLAFDFIFGLKSASLPKSVDIHPLAGLLALCWFRNIA